MGSIEGGKYSLITTREAIHTCIFRRATEISTIAIREAIYIFRKVTDDIQSDIIFRVQSGKTISYTPTRCTISMPMYTFFHSLPV